MKMTLLEYVQDILNDMDSDEVNSIQDTVESEQVAQIVKSTFYAMMSDRNWPHTKKTIILDASGESAKPTHMKLPDNVKELISVHYNCAKDGETRRRYRDMRWMETDTYLRKQNGLNTDSAEVDIILDYSGVELAIRSNSAPTGYTSFDDKHLVFDSYDSEVDDTLKSSKIQALAYVTPDWTHEDTFIPDLPEEAVTALLEAAKGRAMFKLKQMVDITASREEQKQNRWLSRKSWRVNGGIRYPNYGRGRGRSINNSINYERDI